VQRIVDIRTEPELFAALASSRLFNFDTVPQFSDSLRQYYALCFRESHREASFVLIENERPVVLVWTTLSANGIDFFGVPLRLFWAEEVSESRVKAVFGHIDSLAEESAAQRILVTDLEPSGSLSAVGKACLDRQYRPGLRLSAQTDLTCGADLLRQRLRKSYRSLVNWGKNNQRIVTINRANPERGSFDLYQQFHLKVAGRVTRAQETWDCMFDIIAGGGGELTLGFLEDDLVAGTMVLDGNGTSLYASGVYDRDRFDLPLAHWPLWLSILRAAERGQRRFEIGDIPIKGCASDKEVAIGYFKRGFATEIAVSMTWTWSNEDPSPS